MKIVKNALRKALLTLATLALFALTACDSNDQNTQVQLANPASVYCGQAGGTSTVKTNSDGSQAGYCEFSDGQQCDEWALFRGECVPDLAMSEPFQWCAQGMNSPVMSGKDQSAALPVDLLKPMILKGLATPAMQVRTLKASRWRCMTGDVWVCMLGANLPCDEQADLSKTPSDKMIGFCQANPNADVVPMSVTGRASVYEWTCKSSQPMAGRQFAEADAAGYLSNIWHPLKP